MKNYFLPQIRTNKGKNNLQFAGVQIWNCIQPEWKNLSFSCFKREIKQMLSSKYSQHNKDSIPELSENILRVITILVVRKFSM